MATALTSELTRFTDKCNNVLAGGIVKTFEPNSLTPKTSYQDPECTIPNLPEVNLDETGRARIYIQGDYRIQVYSRDGILIEDNLLVEQSLVQRDFVELSQSLQVEQQVTLNQFQAKADDVIAKGFYTGYATETALKASLPAVSEMRARADDTRKIWRWNRTSAEGITPVTGTWIDTGLSDLDQAKVYATNEALNATSMLQKTSVSNLHEFADLEGGIVAALNSSGEFEAQDFKTESGYLSTVTKAVAQQEVAGYTHAFVDSDGNIVFGIKQDGTVVGSSTSAGLSELRAGILSSDDMNAVGLALDAKAIAETPLNYTVEISPHGADGTLHQRMPSAVQVSDTRLFVAFAQFSTAGTDGADGRLVGRFIDFNLTNQTSTVSATQIIDGTQFGSLSRHPVFIKLRNKIVCIFNDGTDLVQLESIDGCQTWVNRRSIKITGFSPYALGLDTSVRIDGGIYEGRVCLAVYIQDLIGVMYSDDDCQTWNAGGTLDGNVAFQATPKINEVSVALDASQNLIFAMRHEDYTVANRYVLFAKSTDGGQTIQPVGMNPKIQTSACQVGFKQFAPTIFKNVPKIIMAHPSFAGFTRRSFRIRVSYDNCQSFISEYAPFADTLDVAYSSVCILGNAKFSLVYEEGQTNVNQSIKIKFLNLAEII